MITFEFRSHFCFDFSKWQPTDCQTTRCRLGALISQVKSNVSDITMDSNVAYIVWDGIDMEF